MVLKFFKLIAIVVELYLIQGKTDIPDPCNEVNNEHKVATMCNDSNGTEEAPKGGISVDSVVLRVIQQKDECVCKIIVSHQVHSPTKLRLRKYDNMQASAPTNANCGLAIDLNIFNYSQPSGSGVELNPPVSCLDGYNNRSFIVDDRQGIRLTSRTIVGTSLTGYCLEFYREESNVTPSPTLTIKCYNRPVITTTDESIETTHYNIENAGTTSDVIRYSTATSVVTASSIPVVSTDIVTKTSLRSTSTDTLRKHDLNSKDEQFQLYIIAGSSAGGGVFMIVLVFVICKCRKRNIKSTQTTQLSQQPTNESRQYDYDSYELKDNILYVSSDVQNDSACNYTYVDPESIKETATQGAAFDGTYHTINPTQNTSNNEDVTVSQISRSDLNPKPSSEGQTTITENKTIGVEYAEVNKAAKGKLTYVNMQL